ncbi:MAG TPA: NAD(P)H-binding protein [Candidatus Dormibacteraeota bacterium]|nr:NAD(P)H-binding protein [Candidatus Dormibacteraeota bacterium]
MLMMEAGFDVVTGAFSFTGRFIARRLLAAGRPVRTLTNHPKRPGADDIQVDVAPLQFINRAALVESLRGAEVLYNTYWIRFPHGATYFGDAVANTHTLMSAAAEAGVRKVVHISVSNPSSNSPLAYYAGKANAEAVVRESGLQWAIVRPTLIFGAGDILINNIAWLLRRMPVFVMPGSGAYGIQPVAGEDVAQIAFWAAGQTDNLTVDAAGPDILSYADLVDEIAIAVARKPRLLRLPPALTVAAGKVVGLFVRDVVLTSEELAGLMDELLVSHEPPRGTLRVDDWLLRNAESLGMRYASELDRHFR